MPDLEAASIIVEHRDRIREVVKVFAKYGIAEAADHPEEGAPGFSFVHDFAAARVDPAVAAMSPGARLCAALGELGTAWIKLGQTLSTRPDIVGPTIADELSQLQSAAPPDEAGEALATVEHELGAPVRELFGSFHRPVTASASVAEVHKATLKDHTPVIVKVVHHGASQRVTEDLAVMKVLAARLAEDPEGARYRPVEIVDDFADMLGGALDLRNEAENLQTFRKNFADDPQVSIPQPFTALSSESVLTMSRETGRSMSDRHSIELAGWDVDDLLNKAADVYLKMIFRDGIFHADPHPGNFLLTPDHKLAILDFGDIGRVTPARRDQLARMALALVIHDDQAFVDGILEFTAPAAGTDLDGARRDLVDWVDTFLGSNVGVGQMDIPALSSSFIEIMRKYGLVVPADMALLARTLLRLQGLAQSVGADVDLVSLIAPYALDIARERLSPQRVVKDGARTVHKWSQLIGSLPDELSSALTQLRSGKIAIEFRLRDDDHVTDRIVDGMIVASSMLASAQLASRRTPPTVRGVSAIALLPLAIGVTTWARGRSASQQRPSLLSTVAEKLRRRS